MPPRLRIALALAGLLGLGILATVAGERRTARPDADPRRSTFVFGPAGASGWAEGLQRLGTPVERVRQPHRLVPDSAWPGALVAVLAPTRPLDPFEANALAEHVNRGGHVLLAGASAGAGMRCLGYDVEPHLRDSLPAVPTGRRARERGAAMPWVHATLRPTGGGLVVDTVEAVSGVIAECVVPAVVHVDTLLVARGRPVALELTTTAGGRAVLVADGSLFSNSRLRTSAAGPFALRIAAGRYQRILVDEYHHGYGPRGNLAGVLLDWSLVSPWGWAVWQLALVGTLALLAGAVRFGRPRPLPERRRRSALEHVRALATALAAARGHDVAIRLLVQGLRRRLARTGAALRDDPHRWLETLRPHLRTPRAEAAAATLASLTVPPQPAGSVLRAAHAVEDLWEELRP